MTFYLDDDEAREDWHAERDAFQRPADEEDQLPPEIGIPRRFWIDGIHGLPVVRDRLYKDAVVARFITLAAAVRYRDLREVGVSHLMALLENPEVQGEDLA